VLAYRSARLAEALSLIDGLIKEQPGNPYFQEMKGQALL
jgi:predicted Zn-dependent protease